MKSALKKVSLILAICFVAFHLYTAAFGTCILYTSQFKSF